LSFIRDFSGIRIEFCFVGRLQVKLSNPVPILLSPGVVKNYPKVPFTSFQQRS
jgi:hypothetical protein